MIRYWTLFSTQVRALIVLLGKLATMLAHLMVPRPRRHAYVCEPTMPRFCHLPSITFCLSEAPKSQNPIITSLKCKETALSSPFSLLCDRTFKNNKGAFSHATMQGLKQHSHCVLQKLGPGTELLTANTDAVALKLLACIPCMPHFTATDLQQQCEAQQQQQLASQSHRGSIPVPWRAGGTGRQCKSLEGLSMAQIIEYSIELDRWAYVAL